MRNHQSTNVPNHRAIASLAHFFGFAMIMPEFWDFQDPASA
jgi:hypothetical protein